MHHRYVLLQVQGSVESNCMIDSPAKDDTITAEKEYREKVDEENIETKSNILLLLNWL